MANNSTENAPTGIGVKQLAEHLGTEPRVLRAFLRKSKRAVGRGTRYEWKSLTDPDAKKVIADWKAAQEKPQQQLQRVTGPGRRVRPL